MSRPKKKLSKEEKLAKDRLRKKQKYMEIKNNPELYSMQKEKERKRYILKKEQKKIQSIKEMSLREQREQRRRWRKNSRKYLKKKEEQKKIRQILIDNSPPDSDNNEEPVPRDPNIDPLGNGNQPSLVEARVKSVLARRSRYRTEKVIKNLKKEMEKLKQENNNLKKQIKQFRSKVRKPIDTLEKKVDNLVRDIPTEKVKEVKKKLLFEETLSRGITAQYQSLKKTEKRSFVQELLTNSESRLMKYKIKSKIPFTVRKNICNERKDKAEDQKQEVQKFFEDDNNSSVAPGKNDFNKRVKKQKRFLTDNLKNLHTKYCKEQSNISYATFCKFRPDWVEFPDGKRETCLCKLHCNAELLLKSLKSAKIITEGTVSEVLVSLCCDSRNENCLNRTCDGCKHKSLNYKEFDNTMCIKYKEWIVGKKTYLGKNGKQQEAKITTKKTFEDKPRNVILKLENTMDVLFKHTRNIVVQTDAIKALKRNLTNTEVLIHVDFSENYCLKFNEEVQSFHFGGSRGQISLHTVEIYYVDNITGLLTNKSLCTMSECLNHDASAIWAHIKPVLNVADQLVPSLSKIHFLSDSPSSQYRNRFIFYMIAKLRQQIPTLDTVTWNYLEAGHGKGAPDGIGAVVKRTADDRVKYGCDVGTFEDFQEVLRKNITNIELIVVPDDEISLKKFPKNVPGFKGTTKVHQAIWSSSFPYNVTLRSLSCFICQNSYLPCEHGKHLGELSVGIDEIATRQSTTYEDHDMDISFENRSTLQIDSPTIYNNIDENVILNEFDGTMFLNTTALLQSAEKKENITDIEIPSDAIQIDCVNTATQQNLIQGFDNHQQEFEKFLQCTTLNNIPESQCGITIALKEQRNRLSFNKKLDQRYIDKVDQGQVNPGKQEQEATSEKKRKIEILSNIPLDFARLSTQNNVQRKFDRQHQQFQELYQSPVSTNIPITDYGIAMGSGSSLPNVPFDQARVYTQSNGPRSFDTQHQEFQEFLRSPVSTNIPAIDYGIAMDSSQRSLLSNVPFDYAHFNTQNNVQRRFDSQHQQFQDLFQSPVSMNIPVSDHGIAIDPSCSIGKGIEKNLTNHDNSEQEHDTPIFMDIDQDKENMDVAFKYNLDDWIIVQYKIKNKSHYYIGKIINKDEETREYNVGFLKRYKGKEMKFIWPTIPDKDLVPECQIIQRLKMPEENRRGQLMFNVLPNLNFK